MSEVLYLYEQAERSGVNPNWLRDQARSGKVPYLPVGSKMLFNPAAVTEALAELAKTYQPPKEKRHRRTTHASA